MGRDIHGIKKMRKTTEHMLLFGGSPSPEKAPNTLFAVVPHRGETVAANGYITTWADRGVAGGDLTSYSSRGVINSLDYRSVGFLAGGFGYVAPFTSMSQPWTFYLLWSNKLGGATRDLNQYFLRSYSGNVSAHSIRTTKVVNARFDGPANADEKWRVLRIIANGASSRITFYDGTTVTEETGTNDRSLVSEEFSLLSLINSHGIYGRIGWMQMVNAVPDDPDNDWILKAIADRIPALPDYSVLASVDLDFNQYSAFGNCARTGSTLIGVWRRGADHFDMPANPGDLYLSTATSPGTTWAAPVQIFTDSVDSYDARDPRITVLSSGRWIVLFFLHDGTNVNPFVIYSDNQGSSWSSRVAVTTTFAAGTAGCSGPIIQLANGDLLAALHSLPGDVRFSRSTDNGATWADEGDLIERPAGTKLNEPNLGILSNGSIMCLIRCNDWNIYRLIGTYSAGDGSISWGSIAPVCLGVGSPGWAQWADGTLTLCTRSRKYFERDSTHLALCTRTSSDLGETWSDEIYPYPDFAAWMYGNPVELADESRYVFYSQTNYTGAGIWWGPL